jgi:hypothetical protein
MGLLLEFKWDGTNWTDETARCEEFFIRRGLPHEDSSRLQRRAAVGTAMFQLDNYDRRFSPSHSGSAIYPDVQPRVLVRATRRGQVIYNGRIVSIIVDGGQFLEKQAFIFCDDVFERIRDVAIGPLSTADFASTRDVDKNVELMLELYVGLESSEYSIDTTDDLFGSDTQRWEQLDIGVGEALSLITQAYYTASYVDGAGVLQYVSRENYLNVSGGAVATFDNSAEGIKVRASNSVEYIINRVKYRVYPPPAAGSLGVLWLNNSTIRIGPNATRVIKLLFRDADTGERCSAFSVEALTPTTDYLIFSKSDGTGVNLTSSSAIEIVENSGTGALELTVTSTLPYAAYFTFLQVRGVPNVAEDNIDIIVEDSDSIAAYGVREIVVDASFVGDEDFARQWCNFVVNWRSQPHDYVEHVSVDGQDLGAVNPYTLDVFDLVAVEEYQTASDGLYRIWAVEYRPAGIGFYLESVANFQDFLIWDEGNWDEKNWGL